MIRYVHTVEKDTRDILYFRPLQLVSSDIVESLPSSPVTIVDIPEIKNLKVEFQYNFFQKNERLSDRGDYIFLDDGMSNTEKKLLALKREIPRFNKITFDPPKICRPEKTRAAHVNPVQQELLEVEYERFTSTMAKNVSIGKNYRDVMYEEAISNGKFSSVHLHDTGADQSFYKLVQETPEYFSPQTLDRVLRGTKGSFKFYSKSLFSARPSNPAEAITNALSNIQVKGYRYAEKDERTRVAAESFFGPKSLEYNFNVNNLFAGSLLKASLEDGTNVYNDELKTIEAQCKSIQKASRANSDLSFDIMDYIPGIKPIDQIGPIGRGLSESFAYNDASILIGYIIEKKEVLRNGKIKFHKDIFIENPKNTTIIDTKVKYGSSYQYKVRAITLTQFEALQVDNDLMSDAVVIARCIIASRGKSDATVCIETVPPPPPDEIFFHYDYENDATVFTWGFPINPQRDIKKFQVFRRPNISTRFELLAEYDFDDSMVRTRSPEYVDNRLRTRMKYGVTYYSDQDLSKDSETSFIYAACSIDAHGMTSNYSEQYQVRFNVYKNRIESRRISQEGAPKPYPNLYLDTDLFVDTVKASGYDRLSVFFDPEYLKVFDERGSDLDFIVPQGEDNPSYFMTILNCDLQESEIVEISIGDLEARESEQYVGPPGAKVKNLGISTTQGFSRLDTINEAKPGSKKTDAKQADWLEKMKSEM